MRIDIEGRDCATPYMVRLIADDGSWISSRACANEDEVWAERARLRVYIDAINSDTNSRGVHAPT